jgi:hypothetical protein
MTTNGSDASYDDAEITRRLVGTWKSDPADGLSNGSRITYNADGSGSEVFNMPDQDVEVEIGTTWTIKEGTLHLDCTSSSKPEVVPTGMKLQNRIISISDDKYVYEMQNTPIDGAQFTKLRVS